MYRKTKIILKEFKRIVNPQNRTIGSVLKHFRKERELTLEEVAKDICSVSYLCKVERDQLVPNPNKLLQLSKKLGIKETDFNPNEKETSYINSIVINQTVSEDIINKYLKRHDYQAKIISFAYALFNEKNLKKSYDRKFEVIDYYFNFSKVEMEFVLYLIIYDTFLRESYQKSVLLFKELQKISEDQNIFINAIVICVKALYKLERLNDVKTMIKQYISVLYKYNRFKEINELKMVELKIMARLGYKDDLVHELDLLGNNEYFNITYLWFNYYFFNEVDYKKALFHINKIKNDSEKYYIHYLVCLEKVKSLDLLKKHLESPHFNLSRLSYQMLFNLLKCKYIDLDNINENNEFLYIDHLTDDHYILSYIYEILLNESKEHFLYKRSCAILEKQNEILKEKASIIYNK